MTDEVVESDHVEDGHNTTLLPPVPPQERGHLQQFRQLKDEPPPA